MLTAAPISINVYGRENRFLNNLKTALCIMNTDIGKI